LVSNGVRVHIFVKKSLVLHWFLVATENELESNVDFDKKFADVLKQQHHYKTSGNRYGQI
tara:strand:+ start:716 stop:895 length:180 start_codon:yes stop_codon:yes gene_type:complete